MIRVILLARSHFDENGTQNYLGFRTINKNFKVITNTEYVSSWKSKGLSSESIKPPAASDNSLTLFMNLEHLALTLMILD